MIFVTVGTQLPFDRMVSIIDDLADEMSLEVFAQTADPAATYDHIKHAPFLTPDEYDDIIARTTVLVGHAGIGTILTAKQMEKPVIVMPRKASLGEHRNEHQLATARHLEGHEGVYIAHDRTQLATLLQAPDLIPASFRDTPEKTRLQTYLRDFVYG
ncbi:glycosyltransferase [Aliiroseovarius sp. F47248L]|uniref:glycosyltransferase n=1 Tax=Aliiroseovarius sp. F47248L TaxID=2926420 RepID=UPI001FF2A210|nr:glycosyltransferase [Aliiroseovarius sp. F47248L]MCK0140579.1 glycosyltransferase family 28 protein [Aliiroseovarius sp. F47248L]